MTQKMKYYLIQQKEFEIDEYGVFLEINNCLFVSETGDDYCNLESGKYYTTGSLEEVEDPNYSYNVLSFQIKEISLQEWIEYKEIIYNYNELYKIVKP